MNTLKYLVLFSCIVFSRQDDEADKVFDNMMENKDKCMKESGADRKIIDKMMQEDAATPSDPKVKCFLKCVLEAAGRMNSKGDITLPDELLSQVPHEVKEVFITCQKSKAEDPCETAYLFSVCLDEAFHLSEKRK